VLLEAREVVAARGGSGLVVVAMMILIFSALFRRFPIVLSSFPHRCGLGGDRWFGFKFGCASARLARVVDFHGKPTKC